MFENHPDLAKKLNNLKSKLKSQYKCIKKMKNLKKAIQVT